MSLELLVLGDGCDVPGDDHGALYGDGVFRTVRVYEGRILAARDQLAKLVADARAIGLLLSDEDAGRLADEAGRLAVRQGQGTQRWSVTSGSGPRGYARGATVRPRAWIGAGGLPAAPWEDGEVTLVTLKTGYGLQPRLAGLKHMNRLDNVLARGELEGSGAIEGIMCDLEGFVVGGTMSNLVLSDGAILYTPQLDRCGVSGLTLERILGLARAEGITVRAVRERPSELLEQATEVGVCNSVMGLCRVQAWGDKRFAPGGLLGPLRTQLRHPAS